MSFTYTQSREWNIKHENVKCTQHRENKEQRRRLEEKGLCTRTRYFYKGNKKILRTNNIQREREWKVSVNVRKYFKDVETPAYEVGYVT